MNFELGEAFVTGVGNDDVVAVLLLDVQPGKVAGELRLRDVEAATSQGEAYFVLTRGTGCLNDLLQRRETLNALLEMVLRGH